MFSRELCLCGHTRRFTVSMLQADGWELRVEHDGMVVRRAVYTDWHRVERALGGVEREVQALEAAGWLVTADGVLVPGGHSTNR